MTSNNNQMEGTDVGVKGVWTMKGERGGAAGGGAAVRMYTLK